MNAFIWWTIVVTGFGVAVWALAADLVLIANRLPSISDYLRWRPWAFWVPFMAHTIAVWILIVHLWIRAHRDGP